MQIFIDGFENWRSFLKWMSLPAGGRLIIKKKIING